MECNATHTHPSSLPTPALLPSIRTPRAAAAFASATSPLPGLTPDSPRGRRRLASSPARLGGKVGRQEERRDERGQGAQKAKRSEGGETKGGRRALGRELGGGGGASNGRREAPDPTRLRRGKRAARRLQRRGPLGTPSPPRIWGRRGSYLTGRCGSACGESAVACAGRRPRSRLRPPASGLLAGPREPRGRPSTPGGARRPAPSVRAGTMEPKLVPQRRGGGEGSRPPPGVSRPCGPPLQIRRRRLTLLAARAPSPCGGPGAAACPTAVLVPCALRSAPRTGEKSAVFSAFPAVASDRGGGRRGRRNALSRVSVLSGRCRPAPGTARAPPRAAAGPEFGLPLVAARC